MLKRNLLIGGLVAGVFVLPSLANAGVVQGVCSNCHTMHSSQNGVGTTLPVSDLLKANGCIGCHANGEENTLAGIGNGAIGAPQVDQGTATIYNAAGYFTVAGTETQHNVTGYSNADALMLGKIPGSSTDYVGNQITCESCHTTQGHHNVSAANYRMLGAAAGSAALHNYGTGAAAAFPGSRSVDIAYDATAMNGVCRTCHADFHDTADVTPDWTRHPVNVDVATSVHLGIDTTPTATDAVVMGGAGAYGGTVVMCLSCHVAHGGPNKDLLAFSYSLQLAGNGVVTPGVGGCETCHSYGAAGM